MRQDFEHNGHLISYIKYGNGSKAMLAFHGFGQDARAFEPIEQVIGDYTVYSFDIFYHGRSFWARHGDSLSKSEWMNLIDHFTRFHDIRTFSLMAFSLGGKFALATFESLPSRVESIILLAPDGIETQLWYNLATYPLVFQNYFQSMIVKPHRFHRIMKWANKLGVVDKGILKFAASQMNTVKKRRRVYYSWIAFKKLTFNINHVAELMNEHSVNLTIYTGLHDKIITSEGMQRLTDQVRSAQIIELNSGHNDLITHTAKFLKQNS